MADPGCEFEEGSQRAIVPSPYHPGDMESPSCRRKKLVSLLSAQQLRRERRFCSAGAPRLLSSHGVTALRGFGRRPRWEL